MGWFMFLFCIAGWALPKGSEVFCFGEPLYQEQINGREVAVFDNLWFGRLITVDGVIAKTQKDEAMYHEMLAHPAMVACGKAASVLILGGGDGALLREVIRHKEVQRIVLVEPSVRWKEIALQYFPDWGGVAWQDTRLQQVVQGIEDYLAATQDQFDCILCDLPLQKTPFSSAFYTACQQHLTKTGLLVHKSSSPFLDPGSLRVCLQDREKVFGHATFYGALLPSDVGGMTMFAWSGNEKHKLTAEMLKKRMGWISGKMQYYTPALQKAAFQLPRYVLNDILGVEKR